MKNIILSMLVLLISACSFTGKQSLTPEKQIVLHCPSIKLPEKPDLEIEKITPKSSDGEVLQAYGVSLEQTIIYSNTLEKLLNNYNNLEYTPIK